MRYDPSLRAGAPMKAVAILSLLTLTGCWQAVNIVTIPLQNGIADAVYKSFTRPTPGPLSKDDPVVKCHLRDSADLEISLSICKERGGWVD